MEHGQFLPGGLSQIRRGHSLALARVPELFRVGTMLSAEGLDHNQSLMGLVNNVKR